MCRIYEAERIDVSENLESYIISFRHLNGLTYIQEI